MGNFRYTVLGQVLCCSQDLFNFITSGSTKTDPSFNILKNVDDFCLFSDTIEGLEMQINKLMKMCEDINLKLSPSKFKLSTAVKFGGTIISSQKIKDGHVIFLDPTDQRILAVTEMPPKHTIQNEKSRTARIQHWPFCVVIFTCWPTIYNPAFQSLFLIWNGLLELELDLESKIRPKSVKN